MRNEEKLQLIQQYDNLIRKYLFFYKNQIKALNDIDEDDLTSEIKLHLLVYLNRLDRERGTSTYIERCIQTACSKYFEGRNRDKRKQDYIANSLDEKLNTDTSEDTLGDIVASEFDLEDLVVDNMFLTEVFEFMKNQRNKNELEIILLYMEGYSFTEIGDILGVSRQAIHKSFNKILEKIRKNFNLVVDIV